MTDKFQIDHKKTTPYHPQTNGQTERVNGTLVSILRKTIHDSKRDWDVKLTTTLWAYWTTFKLMIQATSFSLVYGLEAHFPLSSRWSHYKLQSNCISRIDRHWRIGWQHLRSLMRGDGCEPNILTPSQVDWRLPSTSDTRRGLWGQIWWYCFKMPWSLNFWVSLMQYGWDPISCERHFQTIHFNWKHWTGRASQLAHRAVGARNTRHKVTLTFNQAIQDPITDGRQLCEPKICTQMCS